MRPARNAAVPVSWVAIDDLARSINRISLAEFEKLRVCPEGHSLQSPLAAALEPLSD